MTQRYALPEQIAAEREFLPEQSWWQFPPKYNVAPKQYVPAIRMHDGKAEALSIRWGFIPSWAEGKPSATNRASVEIDRIERSKTYRMPWLSGQRCILPMSGFYLWQLTGENYRQPYFVNLTDRSVFGVAAIWDRSVAEDDDVIESCSIIRVAANDLLSAIAPVPGRMPAILRRRDYQTWLRGTPVEAKAALRPYKPEWMQAYAVSPRINSTVPDDADLIRPIRPLKDEEGPATPVERVFRIG
jgi:putative SOS response-associated peptidase YedK